MTCRRASNGEKPIGVFHRLPLFLSPSTPLTSHSLSSASFHCLYPATHSFLPLCYKGWQRTVPPIKALWVPLSTQQRLLQLLKGLSADYLFKKHFQSLLEQPHQVLDTKRKQAEICEAPGPRRAWKSQTGRQASAGLLQKHGSPVAISGLRLEQDEEGGDPIK